MPCASASATVRARESSAGPSSDAASPVTIVTLTSAFAVAVASEVAAGAAGAAASVTSGARRTRPTSFHDASTLAIMPSNST